MSGLEGNARITGATAAVLFVLLFLEGVTILQVRGLLTAHIFIGLLQIPPVLLKMGSTGYRFLRYYTGHPEYRRHGPPTPLLRALGPLVVLTTVAVLGTGVALLVVGPGHSRLALGLHKASFVVWFVVMAVHVLAHLRDTVVLSARDWVALRARAPGRGARQALVAASLVVGIGVAAAALPAVPAWTHWVAAQHGGP
jgi:hypothetical protein